jgi:hypothetical protein
VRAYSAATECFIFGHGDAPQTQQHFASHLVGDIFGDQCELAALPDAEYQCDDAQQECQQQNGGDIKDRPLPYRREYRLHGADENAWLVEQHLVHQQRQ